MEMLIVIMILAVVFTAFMGVTAQAIQTVSKAVRTSDAMARAEALVFSMESGERIDLASYGGQQDLGAGYGCGIVSDPQGDWASDVDMRVRWKEGRESLGLDLTFLRASVE